MARQARVVVPGELHHAMLLAADGLSPLHADEVRHRAVAVLRDQAALSGLTLHGFVVLPQRWQVLVTPSSPEQLRRFMQVSARLITYAVHSAAGSKSAAERQWEGRFRAGLVSPDRALDVLFAMDCALGAHTWDRMPAPPWGSAAALDGRTALPWLKSVDAFWKLGNTPFERQLNYAEARVSFLASGLEAQVLATARQGWALGAGEWLSQIEASTGRLHQPRSPGRRRISKVSPK